MDYILTFVKQQKYIILILILLVILAYKISMVGKAVEGMENISQPNSYAMESVALSEINDKDIYIRTHIDSKPHLLSYDNLNDCGIEKDIACTFGIPVLVPQESGVPDKVVITNNNSKYQLKISGKNVGMYLDQTPNLDKNLGLLCAVPSYNAANMSFDIQQNNNGYVFIFEKPIGNNAFMKYYVGVMNADIVECKKNVAHRRIGLVTDINKALIFEFVTLTKKTVADCISKCREIDETEYQKLVETIREQVMKEFNLTKQ